MDRTATLTRPVRRWQTNAGPPPKLNSSSTADESVRLADKRPLNPPMLDGVASPFLLPLSLLPSPAPTQNIMRRLAFALLFSFTTASLSALAQEDQSVIGKIVFRYDAAGHQIGYSSYDGAGKLLGQTVAPTASPAKRK